MGVVGSFLLDKYKKTPDYYSFRHHYIPHALESEVLYALLCAIHAHRNTELLLWSTRRGKPSKQIVLPLKIYISTQNGRRYVMAYHWSFRRILLYRLDSVRSVKALNQEANYEKCLGYAEKYHENLWGMSSGSEFSVDHIEMTVRVEKGAEHILKRLEREKRCGRVEPVDAYTYRYIADVYDAIEMLPWIRTFIGRILKLECSNQYVVDTFYVGLEAMRRMYGGDADAV